MAESRSRKKTSRLVDEDPSSDALSISDIKELFKLMRENGIAELQIEQKEAKIHIVSKGAHISQPAAVVPVVAGVPQMGMVPMAPPAHPGAPLMAAPPTAPESAESTTGLSDIDETQTGEAASNLKTILSPMVGTFYGAPAPDAPPFVKVGETVSEETVLCIIEAMKLMNEIKAETKGRIYRVLAENGNPVEYNQPLFLIEP
jgi:acetyl-CoA carboxylase biotin carboxyl carrier protein